MERSNLDFFDIAEQKGHHVLYFPLPQTKSVSMPKGQRCFIGLDPELTGAQERTCLAHELGHCEYGGFYRRSSPLDLREKYEYRANVWAVLRLIPFAELRNAMRSGITARWELAEWFNTTEEMVDWAIRYYTERRGYTL